MRKPDVICLGTTAVDVMARPVDRLPEAGTQVLFDGLSIHPGGGALNQSIALARLGVRVSLAAKVGRDLFGDFLLDTLKTEGVDSTAVVRAPHEPTCFTFAPVQSDGTRRYFSCLGTNATLAARDLPRGLPARGRLLAIGGVSVMPRLDGLPLAGILKAARAAGAITTVDTAFNSKLRDWKPQIRPLLPHADYFFPSIEEARLITGLRETRPIANRLRAWGGRAVGVKLGSGGAFLDLPSSFLMSPAFSVKVLDASGAGDAFMAGFILGLLDGIPPGDCLVRGNAVAAHCIQSVGCTAGLPSLKSLMTFLKKRRDS